VSSSLRESDKFQRGHRGELLVVEELKRRGWLVIPSYDYVTDEEKAPRLQGERIAFVIPDIDGCRAGARRWFEVKTKAAPTLYRKQNRVEHGIPYRHFSDYLRVQEESGCEVVIVVYEEDSGEILWIRLKEIRPPVSRRYAGDKMSRGGMIFWLRDSMRKLDPILTGAPTPGDR
jgi:hypothetical protein